MTLRLQLQIKISGVLMQAEIILLHSLLLYTVILKSANHRQVIGLFLQKKHLILTQEKQLFQN